MARIGKATITALQLERVALAQGLGADDALDALAQDAVMSAYAEQTLGNGATRSIHRTALARMLVERLWVESKAQGEPTRAELAEETAKHWWELDRPVAAKTAHVVVLTKRVEDKPRARALAERFRADLSGAKDAKQFIEIASKFDGGDLEVKAETLPPVALDGRVVPLAAPAPGAKAGTLVQAFARAAHDLTRAGEMSAVVETEFGYHVLILERRVGGVTASHSERLERLREVVLTERARAEQVSLVQRLRESTTIVVDRAVSSLTGRVKVDQ